MEHNGAFIGFSHRVLLGTYIVSVTRVREIHLFRVSTIENAPLDFFKSISVWNVCFLKGNRPFLEGRIGPESKCHLRPPSSSCHSCIISPEIVWTINNALVISQKCLRGSGSGTILSKCLSHRSLPTYSTLLVHELLSQEEFPQSNTINQSRSIEC